MNLQITNWPTAVSCQYDPPAPSTGMPSTCYGQHSGVLVYAKDSQPTAHGVLTTLSNITLAGLTINHVLGQWGTTTGVQPFGDPNNLSGGIVFDIEKNGTTDDVYTAWATVNVIGNTISDVWRTGIVFHSLADRHVVATLAVARHPPTFKLDCQLPQTGVNQHLNPEFLYPGLGGVGSTCSAPACYPPQTAYYYATQAPAPSPLLCYANFVPLQGNEGGIDYISVTLPTPPANLDGGALEVSNGAC